MAECVHGARSGAPAQLGVGHFPPGHFPPRTFFPLDVPPHGRFPVLFCVPGHFPPMYGAAEYKLYFV